MANATQKTENTKVGGFVYRINPFSGEIYRNEVVKIVKGDAFLDNGCVINASHEFGCYYNPYKAETPEIKEAYEAQNI